MVYHSTEYYYFTGAFKKHFLSCVRYDAITWSYDSVLLLENEGSNFGKGCGHMITEKSHIDVEWSGDYVCFGAALVVTSKVMSHDQLNKFVFTKDQQWSLDDLAPSILQRLSLENYQTISLRIATGTLWASWKTRQSAFIHVLLFEKIFSWSYNSKSSSKIGITELSKQFSAEYDWCAWNILRSDTKC